MKTTILTILGLATVCFLPACTTLVETRDPYTHSTRTTTSEVSPTTHGTVETRTTRSY